MTTIRKMLKITDLRKRKHAQCLTRINRFYGWSKLGTYDHEYPNQWKTYILIDVKNKNIFYAGISKNPALRIKRHLWQCSTDIANGTRIRKSSNWIVDYMEAFDVVWHKDVKMIVLERFTTKKEALGREKTLINLIQMNFKMTEWNWND